MQSTPVIVALLHSQGLGPGTLVISSAAFGSPMALDIAIHHHTAAIGDAWYMREVDLGMDLFW